MSPYHLKPVYKTLEEALVEHYRADALKALAKLVCSKVPTRKADMAKAICQTMLSAQLKSHFHNLDDLEKSAVREAVFASGGELDLTKFKAKHGQTAPLGKSWAGEPRGIWWICLLWTGSSPPIYATF